MSQTAPAYRPAPDYETAVLSKYGGSQQGLSHSLYSSQPQLGPGHMETQHQAKYYPPPPGFHPLHPTYSTPELNSADPGGGVEQAVPSHSQQLVYKPPPPYPGAGSLLQPPINFSSSTPDLASQTLLQGGQVGG